MTILKIEIEESLFNTTFNGKPYFFLSGKKLITGGADEAKDVGKVLEDFKGGNEEVKDFSKVIEDLKGGDKVDETFGISGQLDESRYIKYQETTISEFENLSVEDLSKNRSINSSGKIYSSLGLIANKLNVLGKIPPVMQLVLG